MNTSKFGGFVFLIYPLLIFLPNSACKKESHIPLTPNSPPVAIAGDDISIVVPEDTALLSGKSSYDRDSGDSILNYEWKKISGPSSFGIDNKNEKETKVRNLDEGVYVFELTVEDKGGLSSRDSLTVTVLPPTQNELIFEGLIWKQATDSIGQLFYMQTPALPSGIPADSILSVQIRLYDFDFLEFMWKAVGKNGSDPNFFHYKSAGSSVIVYIYSGLNPASSPFIGKEIKVKFR